MKKFILTSLLFLSLTSCEDKKIPIQAQIITEESSKESSVELSRARMILESAAPMPESRNEFSDPAMIYGSSFGNFFISMIRTQNYDMALKFTSKGSVKKNGIKKIREKYENFSFDYKLYQHSINRKGDTISMVYSTEEYATSKFKKFILVVENDSCKLVLPENTEEFMK